MCVWGIELVSILNLSNIVCINSTVSFCTFNLSNIVCFSDYGPLVLRLQQCHFYFQHICVFGITHINTIFIPSISWILFHQFHFHFLHIHWFADDGPLVWSLTNWVLSHQTTAACTTFSYSSLYKAILYQQHLTFVQENICLQR